MSAVLLATRNAKKLVELQRVVDAAGLSGLRILSLDDVPAYEELPEDAPDFAGNALIKARCGSQETGYACIADDSGLEVAALNGMPGVLSARWSGTHGNDEGNNSLLLGQLRDVPQQRRGAAFVSACALVVPGTSGWETVSHGRWEGHIATVARGENGFGYDPLFVPADAGGRHSAELSPEEKDSFSHRGQALTGLVSDLRKVVSG